MSQFIVGLDLGQAQDYTAICVLEIPLVMAAHSSDDPIQVRHLERVRGTPYPAVVARVSEIMAGLGEAATLVIDLTGVGRPVSDLFTQKGIRHYGISIHGGDQVTGEGMYFRVPKRDLVTAVLISLQRGKLKIAASLPDSTTLVKELENFRVKIDPKTAHDSYSAWREQDHDDLVLAVALTVWYFLTVLYPHRRNFLNEPASDDAVIDGSREDDMKFFDDDFGIEELWGPGGL